jgi:hypothetical protein
LLLDEEPPVDDLRLVAAAPFLPAVLFLAELPPRLDELELFFEPVLDEPELFEPPLDDLRLVAAAPFLPAALFCAELPPRLDEPELFFEPPLLLLDEPEDEREPVDFLVVAMRIIPPIFWYVPARTMVSNMCALLHFVSS